MVKYDEDGRPQVKDIIKNLVAADTKVFDKLLKTCEIIMDEMMSGNWHEDNDDSAYIYEAAMEDIYGEGIFDFINKLNE